LFGGQAKFETSLAMAGFKMQVSQTEHLGFLKSEFRICFACVREAASAKPGISIFGYRIFEWMRLIDPSFDK